MLEKQGADSESGAESAARRDRKFWTALGLFSVLAVVSWFTLGDGTVLLFERPVQLRWIPVFILGTFAFRAYMAREADKIRRGSGDAGRS